MRALGRQKAQFRGTRRSLRCSCHRVYETPRFLTSLPKAVARWKLRHGATGLPLLACMNSENKQHKRVAKETEQSIRVGDA